jgi:hypothetical protein
MKEFLAVLMLFASASIIVLDKKEKQLCVPIKKVAYKAKPVKDWQNNKNPAKIKYYEHIYNKE